METAIAQSHPDGRTVYETPRRITGWHIHCTCPRCGGTLAHEQDGHRYANVSRAVARCIGCDHRYLAEITLKDVTAGRGR